LNPNADGVFINKGECQAVDITWTTHYLQHALTLLYKGVKAMIGCLQ
jgi:hypothetical protein